MRTSRRLPTGGALAVHVDDDREVPGLLRQSVLRGEAGQPTDDAVDLADAWARAGRPRRAGAVRPGFSTA